MFEVWSLLIHHLGQELVFQPIPSHCKIDQSGLGLNLWLVVRVGQLSVENQPESWVQEALFVPNLYTTREEGQSEEESMIKEWNELFFSHFHIFTCV